MLLCPVYEQEWQAELLQCTQPGRSVELAVGRHVTAYMLRRSVQASMKVIPGHTLWPVTANGQSDLLAKVEGVTPHISHAHAFEVNYPQGTPIWQLPAVHVIVQIILHTCQ